MNSPPWGRRDDETISRLSAELAASMNSPPWGRRDTEYEQRMVAALEGLDELASLGKARRVAEGQSPGFEGASMNSPPWGRRDALMPPTCSAIRRPR